MGSSQNENQDDFSSDMAKNMKMVQICVLGMGGEHLLEGGLIAGFTVFCY